MFDCLILHSFLLSLFFHTEIMDELVDELSGTTIDEEPTKKRTDSMKNFDDLDDDDLLSRKSSVKNKSKVIPNHVERCASIINRSKLLILSDSESNEEDCEERQNPSKHIRLFRSKYGFNHPINRSQREQQFKILSKQKRKNGCGFGIESNALSCSSSSKPHSIKIEANLIKNLKTKNDLTMEIDHLSSSDLSSDDGLTSECNFDGDDEQSDFYDSSLIDDRSSRHRSHNHHHQAYRAHQTKSKLEFKIPRPLNPFSVDHFETHSPGNHHWKRRKGMH